MWTSLKNLECGWDFKTEVWSRFWIWILTRCDVTYTQLLLWKHPNSLRLSQVFVSPRQWTDHWRHCRGGRQASVNLAVCRDLFPWSIKSAPPLIPFDTPVMGMAQSELQPTNPSRPALQRLVMLCYCLYWKMMVIWRWWWWGCGDNDCEDGDLVMKTMILRMMMVEKDDGEEEDGDGREGGN